MNKILIFNLYFFISVMNICPSSEFTVTNTKNNSVEEAICDQQQKTKKLFYMWEEVPLTIQYSVLDKRANLEELVGAMLDFLSKDSSDKRVLNKPTGILVNVPENEGTVTISIWDKDLDSLDEFIFKSRLNHNK